MLHRDLKPANVMAGEHGEVRVMDWGLAMPLPGAVGAPLRAMMPPGLEKLGSSAGTPRYMSPEQARGEPLDERSGVYALGAILYELVALAPPIEGDTLSEVLERARRGQVRPLATAAPGAPPSLRAIIERAMAFDPTARYPTAAGLAEEIETFLDGRTPDAERAAPWTVMARFYMGRDPGHLRVWEIDLWAASAFVLGGGTGAACARWVGAWWPALLLVGLAIGLPPTLHWFRLHKQRPTG